MRKTQVLSKPRGAIGIVVRACGIGGTPGLSGAARFTLCVVLTAGDENVLIPAHL